MNGSLFSRATVGCRTLPRNLIAEMYRRKHRIQEQLEIMTSGRVSVEIDAASRFHHPPKLDEPRGHHGKTREHITPAKERTKGLHDLGNLAATLNNLLKRFSGRLIPASCIVKGFNLGR
jgi:hypothetical protein